MSKDIFDEEFDDIWPTRTSSSVMRYHSDASMETGRAPADVQMFSDERQSYAPRHSRKHAVPARRTATQSTPIVSGTNRNRDTEEIPSRHTGDKVVTGALPKRRLHWLVYVSLALFVMIVGWFLLSVLTNWWRVFQDDLRYGRPRTAQYDVVVGHNDSSASQSHFIALNVNRRIQIIELPGGDATKAKVYLGPMLVGPDQDLAPVTLTFKDVTKDGKLDMIVTVQDSHFVFINDHDQFRPPAANENVQP
jgi:hypothetical protein